MSLIPNLVLMSAFLFSGFVQKWYLPLGCGTGTSGRLCIGDTDHNGYYEMIFVPNSYGYHCGYIYELHPPNEWQIDSFAYGAWQPLIWVLGDFDSDSLDDLLINAGVGGGPPVPVVAVLESPNFFSYPTNEVWRDSVDCIGDNAITVYDVDGDYKQEILDNHGDGILSYNFCIRECTSDNQYEITYTTIPDTTGNGNPSSTHACGDFDGDGRNEFAMGARSSINNFWIYESPANDTYEKVWETTLPTANFKDCFTVPDANRNGKLEFVAKGFGCDTSSIKVFFLRRWQIIFIKLYKHLRFPNLGIHTTTVVIPMPVTLMVTVSRRSYWKLVMAFISSKHEAL